MLIVPQACVDWLATHPGWSGCIYDPKTSWVNGAYEGLVTPLGWTKTAVKVGGQNWCIYTDARSPMWFCFLVK